MKNIGRRYKDYSLDKLYSLLEEYDKELKRYDMMDYDCWEGLAISSLAAEKEEIMKEIHWKESRLGIPLGI